MMFIPPFFIVVFLGCCTLAEDQFLTSFPKNIAPSDDLATRVFGGATASDGQFPYMVFVLYKIDAELSSCSASLVSTDKVLFAAHCISRTSVLKPNPNNLLAIAGKADLGGYIQQRFKVPFSQDLDGSYYGLQERRGKEAYVMRQYDGKSLHHDIALFSVVKAFVLTNNIQPIAISKDKLTSRKTCTIHGWGLTEGNARSYRLMYAINMHALPIQECEKKKQGPFVCLQKTHSGICQGDSGSPLVCEGQILGVASHLLARTTNPNCSDDLEEFFATLYQDLTELEPLLELSGPPAAEEPKTDDRQPKDAGSGSVMLAASLMILILCMVIFELR